MMKILFLDDNAQACKIFEQWIHISLREEVAVTYVSNLVDFDYELYESGNTYDKYILDLGIIKPPEFSEDLYEQWLEKVGIAKPTYINPSTSVLGWDYYNIVMRKMDSTQNRLNKVLLKTGYAELLIEKFGKDCYLPATLLSKGDEEHDNKLKQFLKKE